MGRHILTERARSFGDRTDPSLANIDPSMVMMEELRRSVAMVRWLEERINMWEIPSIEEVNDSTRPDLINLGGLPALMTQTFKGTPYATDINSWLVLYREERAHMILVAKTAHNMGVKDQMIQLAQGQGLILASAIRAVLAALNLSPDQHALVPTVVPQVIRSVAATALEPVSSPPI